MALRQVRFRDEADPFRVTAFCVGDIYVGQDQGDPTHPIYCENVFIFASSDFLIRFASVESNDGQPTPGRSATATADVDPNDSTKKENAPTHSSVLSRLKLCSTDCCEVVSLVATTARSHRRYSELVSLGRTGTITVFAGIHVRSFTFLHWRSDF